MFHRAVCAQLERVEAREIDRLMLLMPPRHGKSELASKSYPAWSIGRKPWKQFISGSASMPLAQDWGREVRNIVNLTKLTDEQLRASYEILRLAAPDTIGEAD